MYHSILHEKAVQQALAYKESLPEPEKWWDDFSFDERCMEIWAIDELIERYEMEGVDEPYFIALRFLMTLDYWRGETEDVILASQLDAAIDVVDDLLRNLDE